MLIVVNLISQYLLRLGQKNNEHQRKVEKSFSICFGERVSLFTVTRRTAASGLMERDYITVLFRGYTWFQESCLDAGVMSCTVVALLYIHMALLNYVSSNFLPDVFCLRQAMRDNLYAIWKVKAKQHPCCFHNQKAGEEAPHAFSAQPH